MALDFSASELQQAQRFLNSAGGEHFLDRQRGSLSVGSRTEADFEAEREFFNSPVGVKLLDRQTIEKYSTFVKTQFHAKSQECKAVGYGSEGLSKEASDVELKDLHCTLPRVLYPQEARRNARSGKVLVRMLIDEAGTVRVAGVRQTSGVASLDSAALVGVLNMRCRPYQTQDGKYHKATALQPISFELDRDSSGGQDVDIAKRKADLTRLQALVATTSQASGGEAGNIRSQFVEAVRQAVFPNISYEGLPELLDHNPAAVILVALDGSGKLMAAQVATPSGVAEWDAATLAAVKKTSSFPVPSGTLPREFTITFRPKK